MREGAYPFVHPEQQNPAQSEAAEEARGQVTGAAPTAAPVNHERYDPAWPSGSSGHSPQGTNRLTTKGHLCADVDETEQRCEMYSRQAHKLAVFAAIVRAASCVRLLVTCQG